MCEGTGFEHSRDVPAIELSSLKAYAIDGFLGKRPLR